MPLNRLVRCRLESFKTLPARQFKSFEACAKIFANQLIVLIGWFRRLEFNPWKRATNTNQIDFFICFPFTRLRYSNTCKAISVSCSPATLFRRLLHEYFRSTIDSPLQVQRKFFPAPVAVLSGSGLQLLRVSAQSWVAEFLPVERFSHISRISSSLWPLEVIRKCPTIDLLNIIPL